MLLSLVKGPEYSKNENLYFLAPAQTKQMQPILVSCEAPFRSNLHKIAGPVSGYRPVIWVGFWGWGCYWHHLVFIFALQPKA